MVVKIIGKAAEYLKKQHNRTDVPITKIVEKIILNSIRKPETNGTGELFKKSLILPWDTEKFIEAWLIWKNFKKKEKRFHFKSLESEQLALNDLAKISGGDETVAISIIEQSVVKGWAGLFELKGNNKSGRLTEEQQDYLANRRDI